ncbi:MAG TPA: beta-N-acetylhexosaminidase [Gemmatimonadaceae bacterium]|nr:beta-N-acetylhexosaminidase [Gemmatimonadaceae bacterium]
MSGRELLSCLKLALAVAGAVLGSGCNPPAPAPPPAPQSGVLAPRIIPSPASLTLAGGAPFELTTASRVTLVGANPEVAAIGEGLAALLRRATGFPLPVSASSGGSGSGSVELRLVSDAASLGEDGYRLTVTTDSVRLVASAPAGLFHGVQTIRQLLPVEIESDIGVARSIWPIPALTIVDQPRFAWRGSMLDVARHFFTVREVEQYIDILALYKLNVLHLGLTNDQGWRIQINSRPKLTAVGSLTQVGGGPGGFYTQQDYQEVVRYAQARYITIVPEIDMPGHINAGLAAYPELSCGTRPPALYTGIEVGFSTLCVDKEETYAFVDDVVHEISALTPGPYLHIGGDEVQTLTPEQYSRFVERAQTIVNKYGKKMIGWEEITKARLKPTTLAQQWKSDSATLALQYGAKIILSPAKKAYLDMKYTPATELGLAWAGLIEVSDAYDWDPALYLTGVTEGNIVGVEAPVWSETLRNITAVEYVAMPRLAALAEVAWTPQVSREWQGFRLRLAAQAPRWHYLGVNYYRSPQIPW